MGLLLVGDVLTSPRPMGPHAKTVAFSLFVPRDAALRTLRFSPKSRGTLRQDRPMMSPGAGRAPKTDA